jgi:hypothetical protein
VSLIEKSDEKNQLSLRHRTEIHLCEPESQPDATGFSAAESGDVQLEASDSAKDLVAEHSSSGSALASSSIRDFRPRLSQYKPSRFSGTPR